MSRFSPSSRWTSTQHESLSDSSSPLLEKAHASSQFYDSGKSPESNRLPLPSLTQQHALPSHVRRRRRQLIAIFVTAVLNMLAQTAIMPMVLLYMNRQHFTTSQIIEPYVTAYGLYTTVPILSHILLTKFAAHYGHARALSTASLISAAGLLLIVVLPHSLLAFYIGYAVFAVSMSLRVLRVAFLSKLVPTEHRTTVLAFHALMIPLGGLLGPLVWLGSQMFRGQIAIVADISVNRFSIDFITALTMMLAIAYISQAFLPACNDDSREPDCGKGSEKVSEFHVSEIMMADGTVKVIDLQTYRRTVFLSFCVSLFAVNFSSGAYLTSVQPILINVFHRTDSDLGYLFELVAIFALIPPMAVSILSRKMKDRQIIMIGLSLKMIGILCFLGPHVPQWRVILGFLLVIKASMFFVTTAVSLFTKMLGALLTPDLIGLTMSAFMAGQALAQFLSAPYVMQQFQHASFATYAVPFLIIFGICCVPRIWRLLDEQNPLVEAVLEEADRQSKRIL